MTRRQELENIIIGTVLESNEERNYYDDCGTIITADMFFDEKNRRVWKLIVDMNAKGLKETTPCDIFKEYGQAVADIVPWMCELVADYSFVYRKTKYNEISYLMNEFYGVETKYTDVRFEDYVKKFIKTVYEKEGADNHRRGQGAAA